MISYHHPRLCSLAALPDDGKWEKLITEKVNKCNGRGEVYLFFNKTNERTILRVSPRRIRSLFWVVLDHHPPPAPAPPTLYLPPPYHRHDSVFTVRIAIKRSSHINNNRQTDRETGTQEQVLRIQAICTAAPASLYLWPQHTSTASAILGVWFYESGKFTCSHDVVQSYWWRVRIMIMSQRQVRISGIARCEKEGEMRWDKGNYSHKVSHSNGGAGYLTLSTPN